MPSTHKSGLSGQPIRDDKARFVLCSIRGFGSHRLEPVTHLDVDEFFGWLNELATAANFTGPPLRLDGANLRDFSGGRPRGRFRTISQEEADALRAELAELRAAKGGGPAPAELEELRKANEALMARLERLETRGRGVVTHTIPVAGKGEGEGEGGGGGTEGEGGTEGGRKSRK